MWTTEWAIGILYRYTVLAVRWFTMVNERDVHAAGRERSLRVGVGVWKPCRVRRGPFPDERMVLVRWEGSVWSGFVNAEWLRHRVEEGPDDVLAKVRAVDGERFTAIMPGISFGSSTVEGHVDRWVPADDPVQTSHS